jgi:hypothetical protein
LNVTTEPNSIDVGDGQTLPIHPDVAIQFLTAYAPDGPWSIAVLDPQGRGFAYTQKDGTEGRKQASGRTYYPADAEKCKEYIRRACAKGYNVYIHVNEIKLDKRWKDRARKEDVGRALYYVADIDRRPDETPEQCQARVLAKLDGLKLPPTFAVGSGNGIHIWLKMKTPQAVDGDGGALTLEVESRNHWLANELEGDVECRNIDRILRIAGIINFPDAKKIAKGRKPMPTTLLVCEPSRAYGPGDVQAFVAKPGKPDITPSTSPATPRATNAAVATLNSVDELERFKVAREVRVLIVRGWDKAAPTPMFTPWYKQKKPGWNPADWSRSEAVFFLIGHLLAKRVDDGTILNILTDERWGIAAHCRDNGGEAYARKQIEQWREAHPETVSDRADAKPEIPAEAIVVEGGKLLEVIARAEKLLIDNKVPMYQRGTSLVHPVRLDKKQADEMLKREGVERPPGALVLLEMTKLGIVRLLAEHGIWYARVYNEILPSDPPDNAASHILDKKGEWDFDVVKGITPAPTLRADGTILQTPGYDADSQLIFDPGGVTFPAVPESPTPDEAREALNVLLHPVRKFPFVSETDRSIFLSALLTTVARHALRTAPLFGFDAPAAGTGKSMLCEMIGVILLGDTPPLFNPSPNDEEFSKQLGAVLLRGDPIVWFDNVLRTLGNNETLCSMFTNPNSVSIRVLGKSKMPACPAHCTVLASGNQLSFADDMTRRVLKCRLDAGVEHPELRKFDFDPMDEVRRDRMKLLIAALTLLRAYIVAGRPAFALEPFGSFADFDLIRSALVWVGMPDPCANRMELTSTDEARDYAIEAMREWHTLIGETPVTIKRIRELWLNNQTGFETLVESLKIITKLDKLPGFDPLRVGQRLKKLNKRIVGGFKLESSGLDRNGVSQWCVTAVERQSDLAFAATPVKPHPDAYADFAFDWSGVQVGDGRGNN